MRDHFPGFDPAWFGGEANGDRRVDAFLVPLASETREYFVASLRIDGCFVPDVVSDYPHIPYDTAWVNAKPPRSAERGVFVTVEQVYPPDATAARFTHRGGLRTAAVSHGWCALFDWDTTWVDTAARAKPEALQVGGTWVATVSSLVAATPEAFHRAYAAYRHGDRADKAAPDWAVMAFFEPGTFVEKLRMIECLLDGGLSDQALGILAAGPVEDLISHDLLDYITPSAERQARWVPLLRGTYWDLEPPDIRARVEALLAPPGRSTSRR